MKYTALASHNNYTSTHGREYSSKSPKPASTYSEGFNFSYNTPKATPAKGFVLPKSNNENLTVLTQSMKFESTLNGKPKTTKSTAITLASSTPSQKNLGGYSYNAPQTSGMRNSAVKPRADILKTVASSSPKSTLPYKSAEPLKSRDDSVNANTQYRWKKLEISTEYNNRNTYGSPASKAQTTKNTEVDDHLQRGHNGYTVPTQPSVNQRAARDERSADPKSKAERPLSSNNNKSSTNINKGMSSSGVFQKNLPSTPVKETTLKKPSSAMLKTTGSDERLTQSTAFSAKKGGLSSQTDMRSSWQGNSESNKKASQRPLSAKKPAKEEVQLTRPSTATKEDKNAAQKTSLNSFVTKVNQGDLFGAKTAQASTPSTASSGSITATSLLAKKRESSAKRTQKPMLTLDDKVTKADTKGPKTTPNVEIRNFTINLGKGNNTPSSAAQKNAGVATASSKTKYGTSTPKEKGSIEIPGRGKNGSQPFVYYMTGLEKAHRHAGEVDYFTQIYREHFIQSYQALSFCKMLRPTDPNVIAQKKAHLPRREAHKDRKTLVFDMDETLIHCNESADMPADVILPITFPNGEIVEAGVNIRPYAIECLKELSQHFEIIVFTASHACYANVVLDYLDPHQQYIHHRLFRDSCVVTDEGVHIKDLRVIGNRALSDMLLIDNAAYSFGFQIENGVPIIPFYDNKNDQELLHLIPYLKFLGSTRDMRDLNKQTFKFDIYHAHDTPDVVLDRLF